MIGKDGSVFSISWPKYDDSALVQDEVEVVVQVNGKVRDKMNIPANTSKEDMEKLAMEYTKIKEFVEGKIVVKIVGVPNKLVNIVVK